MSADITLTLPDDVLRRARLAAQRAGRPVADVLTEAIELSLNPLGTPSDREEEMARWPDAKVLAAADARMTETEDERLSELLDRQQAGLLTDTERVDLTALMARYQDGLLLKAQALAEAVRRGLRGLLQP